MPSLTLLLQHGVLYGVILSLLMSLSFVGAAYLNPEIWLPDYPPDIRERFGPMSERAKRQRRLVGIPVFLLLAGVPHAVVKAFRKAGQVTLESAERVRHTS
jgi:hypothetical protein